MPAFLLKCRSRKNGECKGLVFGGARRDRTADLLRARQALSQLSYGPFDVVFKFGCPSTYYIRGKETACGFSG